MASTRGLLPNKALEIGRRQWAFSDIQLRHSVAPSRFITGIGLVLQYRRQSDAGNDRNYEGASEVGPSCRHGVTNVSQGSIGGI
jgi:hypothetical protein